MMAPINWDELCGRVAKTRSEMAKELGLSKQTMSRILDGAIKEGIIEQRTRPDNGLVYYSRKVNGGRKN